MIRRFCYSNATEVMARHMDPVNGLAPLAADYVARVLLRYAVRAWDDICSPTGKLRFEHDHYLKMWALTRPVLAADFVLLDEPRTPTRCSRRSSSTRTPSGCAWETRPSRYTPGVRPGT